MRRFITKLIVCSAVFFTVFFGITYTWSPYYSRVYGPSMWPAIVSGDYIIAIKKYNPIKRGEVVCVYYKNHYLIKRVIGIPGDEIIITKGLVFINRMQEDNAELIFNETKTSATMLMITLKNDEYYVLGDNRPISLDSRYFGSVKKENITGKVVAHWHGFGVDRFTLDKQ